MAAVFRRGYRRRSCGGTSHHPAPANSRAWMAPALALLAALGIIAAAAMIDAVHRRHVQFDNGTVWVTSLADHKAARFNVKNGEADATISSTAARFDIAQHGNGTMLIEPTKASSVQASTVAIGSTANISTNISAMLGGETAAFIDESTGHVWVGTSANLDMVSPTTSKPQMKLGSGGRAIVTHDGTVYGYRPADGMVLRLSSATRHTPVEMGSLTGGGRQAADSFTVIGATPVIASGNTIFAPNGKTVIDATGPFTLQEPPVDGKQSGWAVASSARGFAMITLRSKPQAAFTPTTGTGEAARPVSVEGCVHAAWSQRTRNYVRLCSPDAITGDSSALRTLESINMSSNLMFRANHRQVILNDVSTGKVWNPHDSDEAIAIQWNTVSTEQIGDRQSNQDSANNHQEFTSQCSAQAGQIAAEHDEFGVRAGSTQILDVLHNDRQTECSVLTITTVDVPHDAGITVAPIYDGRFLQLGATSATVGTATFAYTTTDGRGQSSSATVAITLADTGNQAPIQLDVPPEIDVEQGAKYTVNALGGFHDPDGDPLTLVSATVRHTDQAQVFTRSDGQLTFHAGSLSSGRIGVEVAVSDGEATGTGLIYFSIRPANTLPAIIDPIAVTAVPGQATIIKLGPSVHGTSLQPVQLGQVEAPHGAEAAANTADMAIAFMAAEQGTYYVPFVIMQGTVPATGLVRVDVRPIVGEAAKPVAANDVALLGMDNTAIVEPLSNDIDPMGGVLAVTSVTAPSDSGIAVGLVGHKRVYITARLIPSKPIPISYTVTNAAGSSTGTILLHPPVSTIAAIPPVAADVRVPVRTGGIVSVDVLDHVTHADGTMLRLHNDLQYDGGRFKGLSFISNSTVRYQAPEEPGEFRVTYTVEDTHGNTDSASIIFAVHRANAENKAFPAPHAVQAQAAAGSKTRIPITLTGIDADGDDIQLLGLGNTAPALGRITETGPDYLVYEAYPDSSGTDIFSYAVEDWTGRRAQADIRVGVFRGAADSGVFARDDAITLRPSTSATVPVAHNDISSDDAVLTVSETLGVQGLTDAKVVDNMIAFTAPAQAVTAYIVYTVSNEAGLADTAILTVHVDPDAAIDPPTVYDYRIPSTATIDKRSVDVDMLPWIANPSGPISELEVSVHPSAADHARITGDAGSTIITVELTEQARAVPFTVTNTKHHTTATAFIHAPAYGVFPPVPRPKAPEIIVNAQETVVININDYVRVGAGKQPYIIDADMIHATKSANTDYYVDDATLRFTAAKEYAGPASITFNVADGRPQAGGASGKPNATGGNGSRNADGTTWQSRSRGSKSTIINSAVITLPITIIGGDIPPPSLSASTIDIEAGAEAIAVNLAALTRSPARGNAQGNGSHYAYSAGTPSSEYVTARIVGGSKLHIAARHDAVPGTMASIPIYIAHETGTVQAGITIRIIASTKPLARVEHTAITVKAGESASVNPLDGAFNPFPNSPLTVTGCRLEGSDAIAISECSSTGRVSVMAEAETSAVTATVFLTVRDATMLREREVTGTLSVSVIDVPEPPLLSPIAGDPQDAAVRLSWTASRANGSPVIEYRVSWSGASSGKQSCATATSCLITGLRNGASHVFTVSARNEVGWSMPSIAVEATPDTIPTAPTGVVVKGGRNTATVTWNPVEGNFSAVDDYAVTVTGVGPPQTMYTGSTTTNMTFTFSSNDIMDGSTVTATVKAHNAINWGPDSEPSAAAGVYTITGNSSRPGSGNTAADGDNSDSSSPGTEPEQPEKPEKPEQPEGPEEPEQPDKPEEPEKPEGPREPEEPEGPENPDKPKEPEEPDKPVEPEEPDKPEEPEPRNTQKEHEEQP